MPVVSSFDPSSGPEAGGTEVTITGEDLTGVSEVLFGDVPAASFAFVSDSEVTAVSPAGSGTVGVTVETPGGVSDPVDFIYEVPDPDPVPVVSSFDPTRVRRRVAPR